MKKRRDKKARTFKQIQEELRQQRKVAKQLQYPDRKDRFPSWRFSITDWDGAWGWRNIIPEKWEDILSKLGHFETRTWQNIEASTGSHLVTIKECPNPSKFGVGPTLPPVIQEKNTSETALFRGQKHSFKTLPPQNRLFITNRQPHPIFSFRSSGFRAFTLPDTNPPDQPQKP